MESPERNAVPFELTRRDLLAASVAFGLASCASEERVEAPSASPDLADPLYFSSVVALASAIREKTISSEEAVRACLDRIEEVNERLNAVVRVVADDALARAREADALLARGDSRGPLHGVPMTSEDSRRRRRPRPLSRPARLRPRLRSSPSCPRDPLRSRSRGP